MEIYYIEYSLEKVSSLADMPASGRPVLHECVVSPRFTEVESILAEERERFGD